MEKKQLLRAVKMRHSRRSYLDKMIPTEELTSAIDQINASVGLHIQLVLNNPEAFNSLKKSYGMFKGVKHIIALVGSKHDPHLWEKLGYYGEELVLKATALGLDTCWVGGTYSKTDCHCQILPDEELAAIIVVGYAEKAVTMKEKVISSISHRKHKTFDQCTKIYGSVPDWFKFGVESALLAPSALNAQPVLFTWKDGKAYASIPEKRNYEHLDLGIAKYHFELAAGKGHFKWGNHAGFEIEDNYE